MDPRGDRHVRSEVEDVETTPAEGDREGDRADLVEVARREPDDDRPPDPGRRRRIEEPGEPALDGFGRKMLGGDKAGAKPAGQ